MASYVAIMQNFYQKVFVDIIFIIIWRIKLIEAVELIIWLQTDKRYLENHSFKMDTWHLSVITLASEVGGRFHVSILVLVPVNTFNSSTWYCG